MLHEINEKFGEKVAAERQKISCNNFAVVKEFNSFSFDTSKFEVPNIDFKEKLDPRLFVQCYLPKFSSFEEFLPNNESISHQ